MSIYEKYACTYSLSEHHAAGCSSDGDYLLINSVGLYKKKAPRVVINRPLGRKDYYLMYNYSGTIHVQLEDRTEQLKDGQLLLYRPQEPQSYWYENDGRTQSFWVHFTGSGVEELLAAADLSNVRIGSVGMLTEICDAMEGLIDAIEHKRPGYTLLVLSLFSKLLSMLSQMNENGVRAGIRLRNARIYETLTYIKNHLSQKLCVQDLAAMANLSPNRYASIFKELIGVTPQQFIINARLQKAIHNMQYTDMNIGEIATSVGFEDPLYFSRLFKKHMLLSPMQYIQTYCW